MNKLFRTLIWPFRKRYYKIRLFWNFSKQFYAPWETCEMFLHVNFKILVDFYENGDVTCNSWEGDGWSFAKQEIDYLYKWWKEERPQKQKEIDMLLDTWSEHHVSWWEPCDDHDDCVRYIDAPNNKYADYLFQQLQQHEEALEKEEDENLVRLVNIRRYLWT